MITLADKERELRLLLKSEREEGRQEGLEEAREEAREEGRQEGLAVVMELVKYLLDQNRKEDLERASQDPEFRQQILAEIEAQKQASE